jgi:hypothetical protein
LLFVCFVFSPLMRQQKNCFPDINTRTGGWRNNTKIIRTETLVHLNLGIFFFSVLLSSLCPSNACIAQRWLVYYLSLFISLALHFSFFFFSLFSFLSLLPISSYPSILDITSFTIASWIILNYKQVQGQ